MAGLVDLLGAVGSVPFALALSLEAFTIVVGSCMQKAVGTKWFIDSGVLTDKTIFKILWQLLCLGYLLPVPLRNCISC